MKPLDLSGKLGAGLARGTAIFGGKPRENDGGDIDAEAIKMMQQQWYATRGAKNLFAAVNASGPFPPGFVGVLGSQVMSVSMPTIGFLPNSGNPVTESTDGVITDEKLSISPFSAGYWAYYGPNLLPTSPSESTVIFEMALIPVAGSNPVLRLYDFIMQNNASMSCGFEFSQTSGNVVTASFTDYNTEIPIIVTPGVFNTYEMKILANGAGVEGFFNGVSVGVLPGGVFFIGNALYVALGHGSLGDGIQLKSYAYTPLV